MGSLHTRRVWSRSVACRRAGEFAALVACLLLVSWQEPRTSEDIVNSLLRAHEASTAGPNAETTTKFAAAYDALLEHCEQLPEGTELDQSVLGALFPVTLHFPPLSASDWDGVHARARAIDVLVKHGATVQAGYLELTVGVLLDLNKESRRARDRANRILAKFTEEERAQNTGLHLQLHAGSLEHRLGNLKGARVATDAVAVHLNGGSVLPQDQRERVEFGLHSLLGEIELAQGLTDQAVQHFLQARDLAQSLGDRELVDQTRTRLLTVDLSSQRFERVVRRASGWLADQEPPSALFHTSFWRLLRGKALLELIRNGQAEHGKDCAADLLFAEDQANDLPWLNRVEASLTRVELLQVQEQGPAALAQLEIVESALAKESFGDTTGTAHIALAAALRSQLDPDSISPERLEQAAVELLALMDTAPVPTSGNGFLLFGTHRLVLAELVERASTPDAALAWVLRFQAKGSFARRMGLEVPTVKSLRSRLGQTGSQAAVYVAGRDRTYLIEVSSEGVTRRQVGSPRSIVSQVSAFEDALARASDGDEAWQSMGRQLAEQIGANAWNRTQLGGTFYVVGASAFGAISVELLTVETKDEGSLLGEIYAIAHLPSLVLLPHLGKRMTKAPGPNGVPWTVFAATQTNSELLVPEDKLANWSLDDSMREQLRAGLPSTSVQFVEGEDATTARLAQVAARTQALHVLCHGLLDPARERPAGIALAPSKKDSGSVWCEDIEGLRVPALVCLSACSTAKGPLRRGDAAAAHVGGAFLNAGASVVVLSPRPLHLRAALHVTERFQTELLAGVPPAEAMRRARKAASQLGAASLPWVRDFQVLGCGDLPWGSEPK